MVAQRLKRLPPVQETRVWSLGREDPQEKEMVTHSSILAWRITWMEDPGKLQPVGLQRVEYDWTHMHLGYFANHLMELWGCAPSGGYPMYVFCQPS